LQEKHELLNDIVYNYLHIISTFMIKTIK